MLKSEIETKTYRELQVMAKEAGIPFVGVAREELVEKFLIESEKRADVTVEEAFVDPVETPVITPRITTTENFGKDEFKTVEESVPVVTYKTRMVKIKPRRNIPRSHIGPDVWELKIGKIYEVPEEVAQIFENGGYL